MPADSIEAVLTQLPTTHSYEAANAAYSGLKSAGKLDLIRDADLLGQLFFYFEDRQAAMEQSNEWILEGEIRFWDRLAPFIRFETPSESLYSRPAIVEVDAARMGRDPEVLAEIVWNGGEMRARPPTGQPSWDFMMSSSPRWRPICRLSADACLASGEPPATGSWS